MNGHGWGGKFAVPWGVTILGLVFVLNGSHLLHAEDITLTDGTTYKNVTVTKTEPDGLRIIHSDGGGKVLFTQLPVTLRQKYHYDPVAAQKYSDEQAAKRQAEVDRLLKQAEAAANTTPKQTPAPAATPVSSTAVDVIYPMLRNKLDFFNGVGLQMYDETKLNKVRYYAIYYSANWCPHCRGFTPELVAFYNEFKPKHPDFEIIFVSHDEDEARKTEYMKAMNMPWPSINFSDGKRIDGVPYRSPGIRQFYGDGIPDLVLVDSTTGKVLSDGYIKGERYGPHVVMDDIRKLIK